MYVDGMVDERDFFKEMRACRLLKAVRFSECARSKNWYRLA